MARIAFFGTPELSVPTLRALHAGGHDVALVVTQADKRRGRRGEPTPSPVKAAAIELGIPVSHRVKDVLDANVDIGVLVAFGRLIKPEILERLNILNLHPSLLPRWRGATPVEAAILAGDEKTGICVMQLVEEMDAGPIFAQYETEMGAAETSQQLYSRLFQKGNQMLLDLLRNPLPEPREQIGEPTFCGKLSKEDFHISWNKSAEQIHRLTRIGRPWTTFRGKRVQIVRASFRTVEEAPIEMRGSLIDADVVTANGLLSLELVQPEGKGVMDAHAWLNGVRAQENEVFE